MAEYAIFIKHLNNFLIRKCNHQMFDDGHQMFDDGHQTFDLGKYRHKLCKAYAMLKMCQYEHQTFRCFYGTFDVLLSDIRYIHQTFEEEP
jgi:hypothetical protein